MAWQSLKVYQEFQERVGGPSGFVTTGYVVVVGAQDRGALEANVAMQRDLGINTGLVSAEDLDELAPMLDVGDAGGLAYEPESGYADPYSVTTTYARRARDLGATVLTATAATGIEVAGGRVKSVHTREGRIETPIAVVAAGLWSTRLLATLGLDIPLIATRHQVITIRRPEDLVPSHPAVGDILQEFSFRPDSTNLTLIGAGEEEVDLDTYNQGVDLALVEEVFTKLAHRMPAMSQGFFRGGWSGLFDVTPDWHPIIDRVEGVDGLFCAVGFSGHGFKLAPMVGVAMAELVLEGRATSVDIAPLRMGRFRDGDLLRSRYRYNVLA
jgi:sarcosine oxidase subunit beta